MIPDPGFPTQEGMARAMAQADLFVQQTRMQAQMQMAQSQAAFTGGIGGAQPGLMGYAGQALAGFGGGFAANMQQQASSAAARMAMAPAAVAALGVPAFQQFGDVIEGARYNRPRMTLSGMITAAYAPQSLFPQAGAAFNMEQRLVRQTAQEEIGRRWTQVGRAGAYQFAASQTMGVSSFLMRRSGIEASWLGEMEAERSAQRNLGYLRGGPYESATGMGVNREFFTQGAGRGYMRQIMAGAGALQRETGMNMGQIQLLTDVAQQSIDPTRGANFAAGGARGMNEMGREVSNIRRTMAQMSQSMQMAPEEAARFFTQLNKVMEVTDKGLKDFQAGTRRMSLAGPFSQMQMAQISMQGMQFGRGLFMGGAESGQMAMQMANDLANQRRAGIVRTETLLREGGGLDQEAMARMMMQRLQRQAQAVQSGNFNQALVLAGNAPQAYTALAAGGAGYFQTQASYAATMIRNPFALQKAWMDPDAMRRVTAQAPGIAFQQAQQLSALMPWRGEQQRIMSIEAFGRQMGHDVSNATGFNNARTQYEELEDTRNRIERGLTQGKFGNEYPKQMVRRFGNVLLGFTQTSGATAEQAANVMDRIRSDSDTWREFTGASPTKKAEMLQESYVQQRVDTLVAGRTGSKAAASDILGGANLGVGDMSVPILGWTVKGARSKSIIERTGRRVEKIAAENRVTDQEAVAMLLGPLAERRATVSVRGSERDWGTLGGGVASGAVTMGITTGATLIYAGYKALTDNGYMRDTYEYKAQQFVKDGTDMAVSTTTIAGLNQKKFRVWMDKKDAKWRDWSRVRKEQELPAMMETFANETGLQMITTTEKIQAGSPEAAELERRLQDLKKSGAARGSDAAASLIRFGDALKSSAGIAEVLAGYGVKAVTPSGDAGKDAASLRDLQASLAGLEEKKEAAADVRLRPLVAVAAMEKGGKYDLQLTKLEGLDVGRVRKWFKHYAATESGAEVMAGKDLKKLTLKEMEEIATGGKFQEADKKRLFQDLNMQAIERSQRLMQTVPLGEIGHPISAELTENSITKIRG